MERKSVMDSDGLAGSLIIIASVLLKAFFTMGEKAVTEISDSKVKSFENGTKKEKRLYSLLEKPSRLITAFSVNRIFSAIFISFAALFYYAAPLGKVIYRYVFGNTDGNGPVVWYAYAAAVLIIMLLTLVVLSAFGEGIPKRIVHSGNEEKLALFFAPFVGGLVLFFTPVAALSNLIENCAAKLFGLSGSNTEDVVTEEEILMMVDAGSETGVIEQSQMEMINNIFEFNDLSASDVMTHRTDIVGVEKNSAVSEIVNAAISSGFSRIPVYEDSMDHIIGIVCVKDLLCMIGSDASSSAKAESFVREVLFVPETIPCGELFKQLSEKHMQMAVAADEYGGTAGIVTMEDILESIVGNIQDEYDDETEEIIKISDDTYTIDGTAEPEHILENFGITLPEDNDFDTMSGFIVSLLGRIPGEDENPSVTYENVVFTVLIVEDMCITKLKATVINENDKSKENDENEHEEAN